MSFLIYKMSADLIWIATTQWYLLIKNSTPNLIIYIDENRMQWSNIIYIWLLNFQWQAYDIESALKNAWPWSQIEIFLWFTAMIKCHHYWIAISTQCLSLISNANVFIWCLGNPVNAENLGRASKTPEVSIYRSMIDHWLIDHSLTIFGCFSIYLMAQNMKFEI